MAVHHLNSNLVEIHVHTWLTHNEMVAHPDKSETMKAGTQHALKKVHEVDIYLLEKTS